jgi:hypothetical protein
VARTFKLDDSEDWALEGAIGQLDLVIVSDGPDFTRASILGRLPIQKGSWRYDPTLGVDWQSLLGRAISESFTLAAVVAELVLCEGVDAALVGDFTIVDIVDTRRRTIDGQVFTRGGTLDVSVAVPA